MELTGRSRRCAAASLRRPPVQSVCTAAAGGRHSVANTSGRQLIAEPLYGRKEEFEGRVRIPPEVARKIGFYVYLYVDPRNGQPFYVGKGQGSRAVSHLPAIGPSRKARVLRELRAAGLEPRIDILAHGLPNEESAFRIEAAVIDALGLEQLTNDARGWQSVQQGRMPLRELVVYYAAKPVRVRDPAILIRINRLYQHGMSALALYEATRGVWRVNPERARAAKYAFAVFEGVVREVFRIDQWHRAGSTPYATRRDVRVSGRWEFTGTVAPLSLRRRYVDRSVRGHFPRGLQSPIVYCGC